MIAPAKIHVIHACRKDTTGRWKGCSVCVNEDSLLNRRGRIVSGVNSAGWDHRCERLWMIAAFLASNATVFVTVYIKRIEPGANKRERI